MRIISAAIMATVLVSHSGLAADPSEWRWYDLDAKMKVRLYLYVFWSETCSHCPKAMEFVDQLEKKYPWVVVQRYETSRNAGNLALYQKMAASLKLNAGMTPAFFYCKTANIGFDSVEKSGARIEKDLNRWHDALQKHFKERSDRGIWNRLEAVVLTLVLMPPLERVEEPSDQATPPRVEEAASPPELRGDAPPPLPPDMNLPDLDELALELPAEKEWVTLPYFGDVAADTISLPLLTLVLASCDAFNPCAFFVLLTLLSVLVHSHRRSRMLFVGGVFVAFSGIMYFLFMAAWLNLFFLVGELWIITTLAGTAAVIAAILNIKDFFYFKTGPSLSIPDSAKPSLFRRMGKLVQAGSFPALLAGTFALAFVANLYELLCTAGFPMVYTRVLTLRNLSPGEYYGYLAMYNLIYVMPLAAIVSGFALTMGSRKLSEYQGRILKLFSGSMLLGLGGSLLIAPGLLQTAEGAVAILAGSLAVTAVLIVVERVAGSHEPRLPTSVSPSRC